MLGVTVAMLEEAQAAGFMEEDEENQETWDDGNGDGEVPEEDKNGFTPLLGGGDLVAQADYGFDYGDDEP